MHQSSTCLTPRFRRDSSAGSLPLPVIATLRAENLASTFLLATVQSYIAPNIHPSCSIWKADDKDDADDNDDDDDDKDDDADDKDDDADDKDDDKDDKVEYRIMILPKSNRISWTIGSGTRHKRGSRCGVDFLLGPGKACPGWKSIEKDIAPHHLRISIHPHSGALILRSVSDQPTVVLGDDEGDRVQTILRKGPYTQSCLVMSQLKTRLRIGSYDFSLNFAQPGCDEEYRLKKLRYRLMITHGGHPARRLNMIPTDRASPHIMGQIWTHQRLDPTKRTAAWSGIHIRTGRPVKVSSRVFNKESSAHVRTEIENLRKLGGDASTGVLGLLDLWCAHGPQPCQDVKEWRTTDTHDTVWYSTPLPEFDFGTAPWRYLSPLTRLGYFYQTLVGLCKIHDEAMIHGRISPEALVLVPGVEEEPNLDSEATSTSGAPKLEMSAAISNLDVAADGPHRFERPLVKRLWYAPEVWTSSSSAPYTYKADVWSLAVSWMATSGMVPVLNKQIDTMGHIRLRHTARRLQDRVPRHDQTLVKFWDLVWDMLEWDPSNRLTAAEVLLHDAWKPLRSAAEEAEEVEEAEPEGQQRRKRVRFV